MCPRQARKGPTSKQMVLFRGLRHHRTRGCERTASAKTREGLSVARPPAAVAQLGPRAQHTRTRGSYAARRAHKSPFSQRPVTTNVTGQDGSLHGRGRPGICPCLHLHACVCVRVRERERVRRKRSSTFQESLSHMRLQKYTNPCFRLTDRHILMGDTHPDPLPNSAMSPAKVQASRTQIRLRLHANNAAEVK